LFAAVSTLNACIPALTRHQEQLIAIDEENASLRKERGEVHALLHDTAQELEQQKAALAEAEGAADARTCSAATSCLVCCRNA